MADESVDNLAQESNQHADDETGERYKAVSSDFITMGQNGDRYEHTDYEQSVANEEAENGFADSNADNYYGSSNLLNVNGNEELSDSHTYETGTGQFTDSNTAQDWTEAAADTAKFAENCRPYENYAANATTSDVSEDSKACNLGDGDGNANTTVDQAAVANDCIDFGLAQDRSQLIGTDDRDETTESPMDIDVSSQMATEGGQGDVHADTHLQNEGETPMSVDQDVDSDPLETAVQNLDCSAADSHSKNEQTSKLENKPVAAFDTEAYDEVDAQEFVNEKNQISDNVGNESLVIERGSEGSQHSRVNDDVDDESAVTERGNEMNPSSQTNDDIGIESAATEPEDDLNQVNDEDEDEAEENDQEAEEAEESEMRDLVEGDDFTVELEPEEADTDVASTEQCIADTSSSVEKEGAIVDETSSNDVHQSTSEILHSAAAAASHDASSGAELDVAQDNSEKLSENAGEVAHIKNVNAGSTSSEMDNADAGSLLKPTDHVNNEAATRPLDSDATVPKKEIIEPDDGKFGTSEPPKPPAKVIKTQECIVCKKIVKCKYNIVRNGDTKHLCDDNCFKVFRAKPTAFLQPEKSLKSIAPKVTCDYCMNNISSANNDNFVAKLGKEQKKFCRAMCMTSFQKRAKNCSGCGKDIQNITTAFSTVARLSNGMADMKAYCSRACSSRTLAREAASSERTTTCSVCSKIATVRREIALDGVMHQLCSEQCFGAFRYANKLPADICDECTKSCTADTLAANTIHFEGMVRKFCGAGCLASFRRRRHCEVSCEWCSTRQNNFDMVERVDQDGRVQRFCSLNCLSLYRVNLQANSGQAVSCDQCRTCIPAQYHLTMSDASVRNFCSYPCVAAFQAQFAMPVGSDVDSAPIPGQKVTANASNTSPASGAMMPPSNKNNLYGTRQSSRVHSKKTDMVISNIVSLAAPMKGQKGNYAAAYGSGQKSAVNASTNIESQMILAPPAPKELRNKALLCKPFMQTKATSCRPHSIAKSTQTDEDWEPKRMLLPCPVPLMMPAPMAMYTTPTPVPILVPVPIPVPCFIPTSRKTSKKIFKKIKEMQEKMPSDPFEAELLMMAEAVAHGGRGDDSDSEASDDEAYSGPPSPDDNPVAQQQAPPTYAAAAKSAPSGEMGTEDMLQMALRMASEMTEGPIMDLEDNVDAAPVRHLERPPVQVQEYGTISHDTDIMQSLVGRGRGGGTPGGNRGKRRSSGGGASGGGGTGGGSKGRGSSKRPKVEEITSNAQAMLSAPAVPAIPQPPADANCMLKFTYGVNAYKHWVLQKNAQIEKSAPSGGGGQFGRTPRGVRLLKLDPLHCTADELNMALCMFVREVRKPNGEQYAPDSILYLCLGIQQYLFENNRIDNIFTDFYYERFTECLNEILSTYEVSLNSQGLLVCRIEEEHLWECKQLGAHSPHVLLNTLIYFNTKHFMLRTPPEHLALSFSHIMKHWKKTSSPSGKQGRSVYLRYYSPAHNVTDPSGQKRRKEELPVFEQAENVDNPLRCPVKLYEFYLSKCPESIKNRNDVFYLVPERSCVPDSPVWYSTMSLGCDAMTKMLNRLRPVREIQEAHLQAAQIPGAGGYYG